MASLSGVSGSSNLSSLMNSANMISGLASGMDTEGMIESLVKSYQTKITQLNQKITKVEWKQDSYRSIISKMVALADKYTSYTSSTNLMSRNFFTSAVTVSALGKYADAVSASGKTSSNISLNAVKQLATAAQYRTSGNLDVGDGKSVEASGAMNLEGWTTLGNLNGSMTLTYGSQKVSISFDQVADVQAMDEIRAKLAEEMDVDEQYVPNEDVLAELINQKLGNETINLAGGKSADASERIRVSIEGGKITFSDKSTAGNKVFISGASGNVGAMLGIKSELENVKENESKLTSFEVPKSLTQNVKNKEYLSGKTMNMSLDGVSKSITLPRIASDDDGTYFVDDKGNAIKDADGKRLEYTAENYTKLLNDAVQKAFNGKVKVSNMAADPNDKDSPVLKLRFDVPEGSDLLINTSVGDTLGIGRTASSYLNTSKTLGELLGEDGLSKLTPTGKKDKNGNDLYAFEINGVTVGNYSKNTKLSELMNDINNSDAGVKLTYSQTTKNFLFESKETGVDSKVELGDGLAKAMFGVSVSGEDKFSDVFKGIDTEGGAQNITFKISGGSAYAFNVDPDMTMDDIIKELNESPWSVEEYVASYDKTTGKIIVTDSDGNTRDVEVASKTHFEEVDGRRQLVLDEKLEYANASKVSYTAGQDAIFNVTVNGETMNMTRSSNTVNIDGMTITMKDTFEAEKSGDAVTFKSNTDSDKIVDVIKELVNDYNVMMAEIKSAYSTLPYQNSSGAFSGYEPLTEEDMEGMSESAIARYEEKAKQGILFGDRTLSTLYDKLNQVFSFSNKADVDTLKDMGITVSYSISGGTQAVTIDEDKLRAMLDSDPDRVADLFTKTDGVMDRMKTQLDNYARTTGEPKGLLIQQAGSPLSSLSLLNNSWQKEIDNYTTQIEKWQSKLESQVERYTSQFARMEQLIAQMNNQSSTLAGLMGG